MIDSDYFTGRVQNNGEVRYRGQWELTIRKLGYRILVKVAQPPLKNGIITVEDLIIEPLDPAEYQ